MLSRCSVPLGLLGAVDQLPRWPGSQSHLGRNSNESLHTTDSTTTPKDDTDPPSLLEQDTGAERGSQDSGATRAENPPITHSRATSCPMSTCRKVRS